MDISSSSTPEHHSKKTTGYFILAGVITVLWIITIPGWNFFFANVLNSSSPADNVNLCLILLSFYVLFMFNSLMDSVFYGLGKTELMALQAIICKISVIPYILVETNIIPLTLNNIALFFGGGIALDSVITLILYLVTLKKCNYVL